MFFSQSSNSTKQTFATHVWTMREICTPSPDVDVFGPAQIIVHPEIWCSKTARTGKLGSIVFFKHLKRGDGIDQIKRVWASGGRNGNGSVKRLGLANNSFRCLNRFKLPAQEQNQSVSLVLASKDVQISYRTYRRSASFSVLLNNTKWESFSISSLQSKKRQFAISLKQLAMQSKLKIHWDFEVILVKFQISPGYGIPDGTAGLQITYTQLQMLFCSPPVLLSLPNKAGNVGKKMLPKETVWKFVGDFRKTTNVTPVASIDSSKLSLIEIRLHVVVITRDGTLVPPA